ncbi:hypothetical protein [Massilia sp. Root335]|uniref:hypothetical protein n=1 Tax=Massilia sp. Root335 TaxID=1736517 RepID=UPI0012F640F0|nr:hypothetical protein [Massilia sp. Root335]
MALFLKTVSLKSLERKLTLSVVNNEWAELSKDLLRKGMDRVRPLINAFPHGGTVSLGLETFAPNFVQETLICIDDFERQTYLKPEEILGLINELKEERGCKIALIFNSERLSCADVYRSYREKVVDFEVSYAPTVREAFDLVFAQGETARKLIWPHVQNLEITNVRILQKIKKIVRILVDAIDQMHENVVADTVASAVLFSWCSYASSPATPNVTEIDAWNDVLFSVKKRNDEEDIALPWVGRLKAYGFNHVNDLDLALAKVVEQGYLAGTGFVEAAQQLHDEIVNRDRSTALHEVWDRFYRNFSGTADEFIADIRRILTNEVEYIGVNDLNGAVWMLRQLGRGDLADESIEKYIEAHQAQPKIFDLSGHPFGGSIDDVVLRTKFDEAHTSLVRLPSLDESLKFMVKHSGYNPEHIEALLKATVEEYEAVFLEEHSDVKLASLIKWSLKWDGDKVEISRKAKEALQRIKATTPLNAIRVGRYLN